MAAIERNGAEEAKGDPRLRFRHRLGDAPICHALPVEKTEFSPDGILLATLGKENSVSVWHWNTLQRKLQLQGSAFAFSPDGVAIFHSPVEARTMSDGDEAVTVTTHFEEGWLCKSSLQTGETMCETAPSQGRVLDIASDGKAVAVVRLVQPIEFLEAESLKPLFSLDTGHHSNASLTFIDDRRAVTKGYTVHDKELFVWDIRTKQRLLALEGSVGPCKNVSVFLDGKLAASGGPARGLVRVWSLETGNVVHDLRYSAENWILGTTFSPDGKRLIALGQGGGYFSDGRVKVWSVDTWELLDEYEPSGHPRWLHGASVSPDGRWLVCGAGDGRVRAWDQTARQERRLREGHSAYVVSIAAIDDVNVLTSGFRDVIRRWDSAKGDSLGIERSFDGDLHKISYSPTVNVLATTHPNKCCIRLWQPHNGSIASPKSLVAELSGHSARLVRFSADGQHLISGSWDGTIRLWDVQKRLEVGRIQVHEPDADIGICSVSLLSERKFAVTTQTWSSCASVWDWSSQSVVAELEDPIDNLVIAAVSPDQSSIAGGGDQGEVVIWKWPEKTLAFTLQAREGHINALAFSPNCELLASGNAAGDIDVFDVSSGRRLANVSIESGQAMSLDFSPDGRQLIAGSEYGVVVVWELVR